MGNVGSTCVTGSVRPMWSVWVLQLTQSTRRSPAYLTSNRTFFGFFCMSTLLTGPLLQAMWRGAEGSPLRSRVHACAANYIMVRSGVHVMKNNNAEKSQLEARSKLSCLRGYLTVATATQRKRWRPGSRTVATPSREHLYGWMQAETTGGHRVHAFIIVNPDNPFFILTQGCAIIYPEGF